MNSVVTYLNDQTFEITLSKPDVGNAYDVNVIKELIEAFQNVPKKARVIVFGGNGKTFCSGADLNWMKEAQNLSEEQNLADAGMLLEMYSTIYRSQLPIIGKVHGRIYGGGVGLTSLCDIVVAEKSTTFSLSEARWGLIPGVLTPFLMNKIGAHRFLDVALTAREFSAQEAQQMGLVTALGDLSYVDQYIEKTAGEIIRNAPDALSQIKVTARKFSDAELFAQENELVRLIAERRISKEAREGLSAFFNKKIPDWNKS